MSRGKLAIVGIGEVPTGRIPGRSRWDILLDVCMQAVKDAGIDKNDIEGVISVAPQAQPRITSEIAFGKIPEELGLKGCKDISICNAGGASTTNCLRLAEQWIDSGMAKIVLIPHVTIQSDIPLDELINFFGTAGVDLQWEYPYGTTYNGSMGLITKRYMYETGTTEEEMASVVVALRKWASLDPLSMFYNKPITIEDVLNSKMVSDPLHARECNVLADGGGALLVTSAELAKQITDTPVFKLGHNSRFLSACPVMREDYLMRDSFRDASIDALSEAGLSVDDLDIIQTYLAYPFGQLIMLEALGITKPGETGKFFMDGHTSPGGKMPCSTIGDAIGRGHSGSGVSMANYIECARQIMGKAGERQVPNCKNILSTAAGGSCMNAIVTIWGGELS